MLLRILIIEFKRVCRWNSSIHGRNQTDRDVPSILEKVNTVGDVTGQDSEPLLKETKKTFGDTEAELYVGKRESQDQQRDENQSESGRVVGRVLEKEKQRKLTHEESEIEQEDCTTTPSPSETEDSDRTLGSESDRSVDSTASSDWEPRLPPKLQRTQKTYRNCP